MARRLTRAGKRAAPKKKPAASSSRGKKRQKTTARGRSVNENEESANAGKEELLARALAGIDGAESDDDEQHQSSSGEEAEALDDEVVNNNRLSSGNGSTSLSGSRAEAADAALTHYRREPCAPQRGGGSSSSDALAERMLVFMNQNNGVVLETLATLKQLLSITQQERAERVRQGATLSPDDIHELNQVASEVYLLLPYFDRRFVRAVVMKFLSTADAEVLSSVPAAKDYVRLHDKDLYATAKQKRNNDTARILKEYCELWKRTSHPLKSKKKPTEDVEAHVKFIRLW